MKSATSSTFRRMTMQLWIKGTRCLVRADQLVAISLEKQEDPELRLIWLETTGGRFLFGGWDDVNEVWPTIDALVETLARCDRQNETDVIMTNGEGKVVVVGSSAEPAV